MKFLVLHGPNLNLIGVRSSRLGERVTLDKINKALRRHVRNTDIELKILQTHKKDHAVTFLQRNRNLADGLLFVPASWAVGAHEIKETLNIINLPSVQILLSNGYGDFVDSDSIFSDICHETIMGHPDESFIKGLDRLTALASKDQI